MNFRDQIEAGFEHWGHIAFQYRWLIILIALSFSGALITQVPKIELDMSTEGFLHPDDPILVAYDDFRDQFQRDDRVLIAIKTRDIFDLGFLTRLRAFHEALENQVPGLDEVDSLINARSTRGKEDELIVKDLLEDWPEDEAALQQIKEIALANPIYPNLLISEDTRYTTALVKLDTYSSLADETELSGFEDTDAFDQPPKDERRYMTGDENNAAMAAIRKVMSGYEGSDFEMFMSGPPVFNERIGLGVTRDMRRFLLLALIAAGIFLFVLFRRPSGTILPLVVVLLALLTTLGSMPVLGFKLQTPTQILPAFLMAVGVGSTVHILAIFFQRLRAGDGKEDAIASALGHSGLAVVMTGLTTAGALLSFSAADLAPVAHLGILAPIGVLLTLVYTLTLLPACLSAARLREDGPAARAPMAFLDRWLIATGDTATEHPWKVVVISLGILVAAGIGAAQVRFSHNPMTWFPEGDEIRVDTDVINQDLKGAMTMEVLFQTNQENGLHDPALLNKLDAITELNPELEHGGIFIGKTISLVDILKEINQALNENRPEFHTIPQDRLLVAQELLLFENSGSDDLEDVTDSRFSVGRMTLKVPWVDAIIYADFIEMVRQRYVEIVGEETSVDITGRVPLLCRTFSGLVTTMSRSYVIAFLVITPLMILLLGSVRWGLLSMIPNLSPILITLGVMGAFHFPMDGFTLLIGSIAIGLAVDDTIHFMHNFRRYYDRTGDAYEATRETLRTTGQALLFTSLVLCTGFFIFMAGTMQIAFNFGFLTGLALAMAFLADVTLAPALVVLATRHARL
jgi:predicted RND superfamily exporter protein